MTDFYYEKNPLIQVTFQVRFTKILSLVTGVPSDFQINLKKLLDVKNLDYSEERDILLNSSSIFPTPAPNFIFIDKQNSVSIKICSDYLQIYSSKYKHFNDFKHYIEASLEAFKLSYHNQIYTRIGFMYQNLIIKEDLELDNWEDILSRELTPMFTKLPIGNLDNFTNILNIKSENYQFTCRTGLADTTNSQDNKTTKGYIIDIDGFTTGEYDHESILQHTKHIRECNKKLFRGFITDELHTKLIPREYR